MTFRDSSCTGLLTDLILGNDDLSLPKATVQKIITEVLANDNGMSFAKESRDLLIECCVEFITMISSEANEIAEKDAKKTIACEHITKSLEELGFAEFVPDLLEVAQGFKQTQAVRWPKSYTTCPAVTNHNLVEGEEDKQD